MLEKFKKKLWLAKYYIFNFFLIKLGKHLSLREVSESTEDWQLLKNSLDPKEINKGIVVVGNGPSLSVQDLEVLQEMPSIASNKINLLFDSTKWRPSLVTICDTLLAYKLRESHFDGVEKLLCAHTVFYMLRGAKGKKLPWKNIPLEEAWLDYEQNGVFSPDPVNPGLYEGFSITNQNIQLAIWLGAKKIYIIGVDHFYDEKADAKAGAKMVHEGQNHFHPEYRKKGEIVNNAPIMKMNDAYAKTNAIALSNGVEVINISRKTGLDVFPKSTVEAVLESMKE